MKHLQVALLLVAGALTGALMMRSWSFHTQVPPPTMAHVQEPAPTTAAATAPTIAAEPSAPSPVAVARTPAAIAAPKITPGPQKPVAPKTTMRKGAEPRRHQPVNIARTQNGRLPLVSAIRHAQASDDSAKFHAVICGMRLRSQAVFFGVFIMQNRDPSREFRLSEADRGDDLNLLDWFQNGMLPPGRARRAAAEWAKPPLPGTSRRENGRRAE
jgi:hypothetical protein